MTSKLIIGMQCV